MKVRAGRTRCCRVVAVVLFVVTCETAPARALSLTALSLEELTESAALVIRGRCIDRVPTRRNGRIESVARFEVVDTFVGAAPTVVEVRQWGGEIDEYSTMVPGAPLSSPDDEAVLFLEEDADGTYRAVGAALGHLPIVISPLAQPLVRVSRVLGPEFGGAATWPLERFGERVRRLARSR